MRIISGILAIALIIIGGLYAVDKGKIDTANQKAASLESQLTTANTRVTILNSALATANTNVASLTNNLTKSNAQVPNLTANLTEATLQIGKLKSQLPTGYFVADPTYADVLDFIASDLTDKNAILAPMDAQWDICNDVINNAANQHIRCAFVFINKVSGTTWGIIGFNTTDKGMVYIEPRTDELVELRAGERFYLQIIPKPGIHYARPDYDDTVLRFKIIW